MERWSGKVAVVTGASSGIGLAVAIALVREGLVVVGLARRKSKMEVCAFKLIQSTLLIVYIFFSPGKHALHQKLEGQISRDRVRRYPGAQGRRGFSNDRTRFRHGTRTREQRGNRETSHDHWLVSNRTTLNSLIHRLFIFFRSRNQGHTRSILGKRHGSDLLLARGR